MCQGLLPDPFPAKGRGYRLTDETYALPPVEMSQGDLANLAAVRAALGRISSLPAARAVDGLLGKIAEAAPAGYAEILDKIGDRFGALHEAPARIESDTWTVLSDAVAAGRVIAARYRRFDGAERDYVIEPLRLVSHRGNWYALARKRPGGELRAFALSRFASATPTGETFHPPKHFDWCRAAKDTFGIGLGGRQGRVRLLFSKPVAAAITERVWHPSQQILHRQDGKVELRLRAVPGIEPVRWILSWTPDVRVLGPGSSAICNPTVETVREPVNSLTEEPSQTCPLWSEHGIRPSAAQVPSRAP